MVTGGPVHAKLDAVKYVTNRFRGGLMALLADQLAEFGDVTYLCSKGSVEPNSDTCRVIHHDGFHDYRKLVSELAPDADAVILGAAVANLIPVCYHSSSGNEVTMPLDGKFPSHDYSPGDIIHMDWQIAPRIIDEVKASMKKGAHLFGFKLLKGVPHEELKTAAYGILLESRATTVFANDASDLKSVYAITKDRGEHPMPRSRMPQFIINRMDESFYRTEVIPGKIDGSHWHLIQGLAEKYRVNYPESQNGMVFGTIACRIGNGSFVCTGRGKRELDEIAVVDMVDHDTRTVCSVGKKATLNAPLIDHIFKTVANAHYVVHFHRQSKGLPTYAYATPGTVEDSIRQIKGSFNVENHGSFLIFTRDTLKDEPRLILE